MGGGSRLPAPRAGGDGTVNQLLRCGASGGRTAEGGTAVAGRRKPMPESCTITSTSPARGPLRTPAAALRALVRGLPWPLVGMMDSSPPAALTSAHTSMRHIQEQPMACRDPHPMRAASPALGSQSLPKPLLSMIQHRSPSAAHFCGQAGRAARRRGSVDMPRPTSCSGPAQPRNIYISNLTFTPQCGRDGV